MATVLHIATSPRSERSRSRRVANAFLEAYRAKYPKDRIDTVDVWDFPIIEVNGPFLTAKYDVLHGNAPSDSNAAAMWEIAKGIARPLINADKLVLSVPMWNFGIPYKLKQFIDVVTQPTVTFRYSPEEGYVGLVQDKPTLIIYARGGAYLPGTPAESLDHQRPYVRTWLQFIGIATLYEVVVEPTLGDPKTAGVAEEHATAQALDFLSRF